MRAQKFNDVQLKNWVDEEVMMRKALATHDNKGVGAIAYTGEVDESILLYDTDDFVRVSKVLGIEFEVEKSDSYSGTGLEYTAYFNYMGMKIMAFMYSEEELNGTGTCN